MRLSPIIDSVAGQFAGRVKVGKVNVHENFELAAQYRISSIPRVYVFKGGQTVEQAVGALPENQLVGMINRALGN